MGRNNSQTPNQDEMEKSYLRLERRNTRFKMSGINQSEGSESMLLVESKEVLGGHKQSIISENSFGNDLMSMNKTDPDYKKEL